MSGVARTLDEQEEKARQKGRKGQPFSLSPSANIEMYKAGQLKRDYGQRHDIDTSEGYYRGKEKHEREEEEKKARDEAAKAEAEAKAAAEAAESAATERKHKSQRDALKRKGRRASILTGPQGTGDELGSVDRPSASKTLG